MAKLLVQYVVVRGDLLKEQNWPIGAVIAQACHATTAVIKLFSDDSNVDLYTRDLDSMHKIVLEAANEAELKNLSEKLKEQKIDHKLWIEQPENYATCLATKPYPREDIKSYFKKFKLYK